MESLVGNPRTGSAHAFLRRALLPGLTGMILLAVWFGGVSWATDAGIRRFERNTVVDPARPADPQPWRNARFFIDPDSYCWLSYARDLRASGGWRLRFTHADNAPYGREMHWSHLPIWSLMGLARVLESAAGRPPDTALELAGRILLPLFGWFFFSALFLLLGSRLGWRIAAAATATLAVMVQWNFHTLRPDHHGFQLAFAAGLWLCLAFGGMGWVRSRPSAESGPFDAPPAKSARRWFIASGILGGLGLWVGATVFLFVLAAIAFGAAVSMVLLRPPAKESVELHPALWRLWGLSGALTSLGFYAVEYAPHSMAMRLETNHPLYALCWLGTAECLRAIAQWRNKRRMPSSGNLALAVAALCAGAALPLLQVVGPAAWFIPRSELILRLCAHHINEFWTLFTVAGSRWPLVFLHAFGLPVLAGIGALVLFFRGRLSFSRQTLLLPLGGLSLLFVGLYLWQIRWALFVLAASLLFTAYFMAALVEQIRASRSAPGLRAFLAVLSALFVFHFVDAAVRIAVPIVRIFRVEKVDPAWLTPLLQRNLMMQLQARAQGLPQRFMLPAELGPAAYYFRAGDAIGSLYWENLDGLAAATAFFGDPLPGARAREIARERGITHVLMNNGAGDAVMFYQMATGASDHPGASRTVGGATARAGTPVPAWLRSEPELNATANPTYHTLVPSIRQWVPLNLPLWIYRIEP